MNVILLFDFNLMGFNTDRRLVPCEAYESERLFVNGYTELIAEHLHAYHLKPEFSVFSVVDSIDASSQSQYTPMLREGRESEDTLRQLMVPT